MADKTTSWILQLVDRVSGTMRKIAASATPAVGRVAELSRHLDAAQEQSGALTRRLGKLTLAAGAFAALSYGSLQFEDRMAAANTMAGKGQQEFAQLTEQIRDMSEHIGTARDQLADGLYATISAGVPENNWIAFLEDSAKAAKGGQAELGTVIGATATIIKNYQESWENATLVQDKFQKAVKLGQIESLEELAAALPKTAVLASQLKVSQDELIASFATGAGPMGTAAEVSTQLSAALAAMLKPTSEATEMAKKLGLSFNAQSIQQAGGLRNFITELMTTIEAYSKRTGASQEEIVGRLFGSQEAIKGVMSLGGTLADTWAKNTNEIANSAGAVNQAFETMNATTTSQIQMMRNAFGNAIDDLLILLLPFVIEIIDATKSVLQLVRSFADSHPVLFKFIVLGGAAVFALTALSTIIQLIYVRAKIMRLQFLLASANLMPFLARVKAASIAVLQFSQRILLAGMNALKAGARFVWTGITALASMVGGLVTATAAQWGLNIAMDANPIGLIILGIAALVGIVTVVTKKYEDWGAAITLAMGPLGMIINLVMSFRRHWDSIAEAFKNEGIISGLKRIGVVMLDALLMPIQQLLELASKIPGVGDLAAKGAQKIADIRKNLELSDGEVNVSKTENRSINETTTTGPVVSSAGDIKLNKEVSLGGAGKASTAPANVKQEVTFNMNFTLPESWRNELDKIADAVADKLTGAAKDAGGSVAYG